LISGGRATLGQLGMETAKASPPAPAGVRWVKAHSGQRDPRGRLKPFPSAPAHFRPNLTPRQMLAKGMHGGIYFNPKGGKPGVKYPRSKYPHGIPGVGTDEFPKDWFEGIAPSAYQSRKYSTAHNCYRVKSGLDQAGWESSGWINECDPRGWTQWYFRFYMGRRLDGGEDERQIARWNGVAGEKGRWKNNLVGKCLSVGKSHDDASVSPIVRQTLLHWAYELNEADFESSGKRVRERGAAYLPRQKLAPALGKRKAAEAGEGSEAREVAPTGAETENDESARSKRARARGGGQGS
jgi:hypothetical protein